MAKWNGEKKGKAKYQNTQWPYMMMLMCAKHKKTVKISFNRVAMCVSTYPSGGNIYCEIFINTSESGFSGHSVQCAWTLKPDISFFIVVVVIFAVKKWRESKKVAETVCFHFWSREKSQLSLPLPLRLVFEFDCCPITIFMRLIWWWWCFCNDPDKQNLRTTTNQLSRPSFR